jgi:HSP90 family molecular chaperone
MGTFKSFTESKGLTARNIAITSRRIEALDAESRSLLRKRALKRATKEHEGKKYEELGLKKPSALGRGVTEVQVNAALADKPVTRKVRAKILRAVNTILAKKGQPAVDMKALFEGVPARTGKKKEDAKKK